MIAYHDEEWGEPSHDPRHLFEMLILEGAQAGLSWRTILHKRAAYRRAFKGFDAKKIARFKAADVKRLMNDEGIVRNRLKIAATIDNARAFLEVPDFDAFVWSFAPPRRQLRGPVPARTAESDALSAALKQRGFRFVGSTIMYAFMQACGLVNDHAPTCFRSRK